MKTLYVFGPCLEEIIYKRRFFSPMRKIDRLTRAWYADLFLEGNLCYRKRSAAAFLNILKKKG